MKLNERTRYFRHYVDNAYFHISAGRFKSIRQEPRP